jgi:hypothetical protein
LKQGLRPTIPNAEHCPQIFVKLIKDCWDPQPSARPDTKDVIAVLEKCWQDFEERPADWNACIMHTEGSARDISASPAFIDFFPSST